MRNEIEIENERLNNKIANVKGMIEIRKWVRN